MARLEKGWHWQRRCAQQIGMRLSCCGSCRTSGPSARHADTFPLWPGRPCASSARSALRSARVTCPRPSSPRRAQPKCGETAGFSAFAHSEGRVPGTRHFALLRRLNPQLHRKFSSGRLFFPVLRTLTWRSTRSQHDPRQPACSRISGPCCRSRSGCCQAAACHSLLGRGLPGRRRARRRGPARSGRHRDQPPHDTRQLQKKSPRAEVGPGPCWQREHGVNVPAANLDDGAPYFGMHRRWRLRRLRS